MKNKNKTIIIILLIIALVVVGMIYFTKGDNSIFGKEKLFNFDQYTALTDVNGQTVDQLTIDEDILNKIENGNYTIDDPLVIVNPYDVAPLTAIIGFKTDGSTAIKVTIKAKEGGKDLVYNVPSSNSKNHYLPIYGLYMDYINEVVIEASGKTKTVSIPIDPANVITSIDFAEARVSVNELDDSDKDFYFVSTPLGQTLVAYDAQGEVRWFLKDDIYKQIIKLDNGHLLLSGTKHTGNYGANSLLEIDFLGKVYNAYGLEKPYYNNLVVLPNGNIIYGSTEGSIEGKFDHIVEYNLKKGETVRTLDIFQILSDIDSAHMKTLDANWGDINSLTYDEKNDLIIVGIQRYSTIVALNYKSGKLEWIFANPTYYTDKFTSYILKPTDSTFVYPVGNYNASISGDILSMFVNGWDMTKTFNCSNADNSYSYAAEYKINNTNKTVSTNYTYDGDKNYFSFIFADYQNKGNEKNILFGREFFNFRETNNCSLYDEGDFESKIVTLNNGNVTFSMSIANSFNNINKMNIYEGVYSFDKTNPKVYTVYENNDKAESVNFKNRYNDAILYTIPLELSGNTLKVLINNEDQNDYKVILVDEYGSGYIYTPNDNIINIKKGYGKSIVLIEKEGELYNTGYYVEI